MSTISKSALISNIGSIQLKLFDCDDKEIDFESKVEKYAIPQSKRKNINRNIQILDKGHYEMIKPFCSRCGSLEYTKQGFREIRPKVDDGEKIKIALQRYKCKSCNKKYSTKLANLKKENNSFFESIVNKVRKSKWNRGGSLRKIAKNVKNFLDISVSHQSIKNFLKIDENQVKKEGSRIVRKFNQLSGYLTIDEEHIYRWKKEI
ncbi:MAG: transposase family protein [Methanobacteriaceae archaeon]|jgi:transposase-like protein|nr:transposase family protein [Candidatus Methanorudis spinitermitis]